MLPKPQYRRPIEYRRKSRSGASFTLIELLVTITIISLLAAMLAPAISGAKNRAREIKCVNNMRQVHAAIMLYANDHNQTYPVLTTISPGIFAQYEVFSLFSNSIPVVDVFHCPFQENLTTNGLPSNYSTNMGGNLVWTHYKINDDQQQLMGKGIGNQDRPQNVVYVIDAFEWSPRHRQTMANVCFSDGHIEMLSKLAYDGTEPGVTPPQNPGWYSWGLYSL